MERKEASLSPYLSQGLQRLHRRFWVALLRTKKECLIAQQCRSENTQFPRENSFRKTNKILFKLENICAQPLWLYLDLRGVFEPLGYLFWWPLRGLFGPIVAKSYSWPLRGLLHVSPWHLMGFKSLELFPRSCVFGFRWSEASIIKVEKEVVLWKGPVRSVRSERHNHTKLLEVLQKRSEALLEQKKQATILLGLVPV